MLPNFLIIGAAKAGTTSLYYYLQQHPSISFPKLKEPKYFSSKNLIFPHNGAGDTSVDAYAIKTFDDYKSLFSDIHNLRVGEASPDYLYFYESTPYEIKKTLGDIPIIIILRDPVKRAFSAYNYLVRDSRESKTFREALDSEEDRLRSNYDFIWGYKKGGMYYQQVEAFKDYFSAVKVVVFEDLISNIPNGLRDLFVFLGVDEDVSVDISVAHNQSGVPNNFLARFVLSRNNSFSPYLRELLKKYVDRNLLEKISSAFFVRSEMNTNDKDYLCSYFANDVARLRKYISNDLDKWLL